MKKKKPNLSWIKRNLCIPDTGIWERWCEHSSTTENLPYGIYGRKSHGKQAGWLLYLHLQSLVSKKRRLLCDDPQTLKKINIQVPDPAFWAKWEDFCKENKVRYGKQAGIELAKLLENLIEKQKL